MTRLGLFAIAAFLMPQLANAEMVFPFLGDPNQANWAKNGFLTQWALFAGMSGSTGSPLYFLALTAVLVGTIAIIFTPKLQDFKTIASWFVLVVVMIFAPHNSRLLFYPIDGDGDCVGFGSSLKSTGTGKFPGVCGFTPQIIAMHVGNSVSVLIYEIFKGNDMLGKIASMRARSEWLSDTSLQTVPPATKLDIENFKAWCPDTQLGPLGYRSLSPTPSASATPAAKPSGPFRLKDIFNKDVEAYFANNNIQASRGTLLNRPAIVLYSAKPAEWDDESWRQYRQGLKELFVDVLRLKDDAGGDVKEVLDACGSYCDGKGQIAVAKAVEKIKTTISAAKTPKDLGYYIGIASSAGTLDTASPLVKIRNDAANTLTAGTDYINSTNVATEYRTGKTAVGDIVTVGSLIAQINSSPNLANMPVGRATFASSQSGDNSLNKITVSPRTAMATMDCNKLADQTTREALGRFFLNKENADVTQSECWKPLNDLIFGEKSGISVSSDAAAATAVNSCGASDGRAAQIVKLMATQGLNRDTAIATVLTPVLTNAVVEGRPKSEPTNFGASLNLSSYRPESIGASGILGDAAAILGKAGTAIFGQLSGIKAAATIAIMQSLVEMAVLALLVVTPIMFLMGLLIPSNAIGLLTISVMGVLILRLVPATLIIIDSLAAIIITGSSEASGGGLTGWGNAQFYEGLVLYMVAGMYGGIIGLTMFIMFKLGDPSNLQSLRELDKAAGQIAETGVKALKTIGTVVGSFGLAGAAGAIGGALSGVGAAGGAKAAMATATKAAMNNVVGRMGANMGAAVSDAMKPPPGTDDAEWQSMSPEQRAKAWSDYHRRPGTHTQDQWKSMSAKERADVLDENWDSLTDKDRVTQVADEQARSDFLNARLANAESKFRGLVADGKKPDTEEERTKFIAEEMSKAQQDWTTLPDRDSRVAAKREAAKELVANEFMPELRDRYGGRLFGDGKSRVKDFLRAKTGGAAWGALSGLRGGWEAMGGFSQIPGAKVIGELLNEGKEAPQRAFTARQMMNSVTGDKELGALATLGLGPVGGKRGEMLSEAAKSKYVEKEAGIWAAGVTAQETPRPGVVATALEGAKQKAGAAIAQAQATQIATQGRGLSTQDYVALGLGDAIVKQAQMRVKAQTIQNAENLNMTGGKSYGEFVRQAAVAKAQGGVADELSGLDMATKMNAKLREKFNAEIAAAGGFVPFAADYGENTAKVAEALRDSSKKSKLRTNARIREMMLDPRNTSAVETNADILKSASARGAVFARNRNWTFDPVKIGAGVQGSFTNARELFMGQVEGMARRILDDKPRAAKVNFDRLVATMDLYNEILVEVGKEMKISTDNLKVATNAAGNKRVVGVEMSKWEDMNKKTFERMADYVEKNGLADFMTEVTELRSQAESQISAAKDRLTNSGEKHGLHVLDSMVIKTG